MKNLLTNVQIEETRQQAEEIIKNIDNGMNIRDTLANIYVSSFAEKSMMQGYIMADTVLESIQNFETDYSNAKTNPDAFIDEKLRILAGEKSLCERCELWLKMTNVITQSVNLIENSDKAGFDVENMDNISINPQDATEEYEASLYNSLVEAIKGSGILLSTMLKNIDGLSEIENSEETVKLLVDIGIKEIDLRAIMSMLIYSKIKNNQIKNIPVDMTLEQVTTIVCVQTETINIMEALEEGTISEKIAEFLLSALGMIAILSVAILLAASFVTLVVEAFNVCWWLTLIALPTIWFLYKDIDSTIDLVMEGWAKASEKIVKFVSVKLKTVKRGLVRVKRYFTENSIQFDVEKEDVKTEHLVTI